MGSGGRMHRPSWAGWGFALVALTLGAACSKPTDNPARKDAVIAASQGPDPGAVAAVTRLVQADLDAIPASVFQLLSRVGAANQIPSDQLSITYGGETIPLDWWLWRKNLIEFRGVDSSGQPLLGLSKRGVALIANAPSWFKLVGSPDPSSSCEATGALSSAKCELKIIYAVAMNPLGASAAGPVAPLPITVNDTVTSNGAVWSADAVDYGPAGNPSSAVLSAMLGAVPDREAARQQYMAELAAKAASNSAAEAAAAANVAAQSAAAASDAQ